jgi:hypothetical protein
LQASSVAVNGEHSGLKHKGTLQNVLTGSIW